MRSIKSNDRICSPFESKMTEPETTTRRSAILTAQFVMKTIVIKRVMKTKPAEQTRLEDG